MGRLGERGDPRGDLALDGRGWVNVNEGTNYWESHLPFGGRAGSASGVGRVGGRFSIERLTELKTIVVHLG
jgi:succinate-semialdehyde dehydrogenase/glutarate-semialdehyde dehydrogenase